MSKNIKVEEDVYDLLVSLKQDSRDSFTRVIRRHLPRPLDTAGELLDAYEHAPAPKIALVACFEGSQQLIDSIEFWGNTTFADVLQAFCELGVDDAALGRRVFVIGCGELGTVDHQLGGDDDFFANCPDFHKIA